MGTLIVLLSFFITSATSSFFGYVTFFSFPIIAAIFLYVISFTKRNTIIFPALIGFTLALELQGTQRLGLATLFSASIFLFATIFQKYISFTSPINRYILSTLLLFLTYTLLLLPLGDFAYYITRLSVVFLWYIVAVYAWHITRYDSKYEGS